VVALLVPASDAYYGRVKLERLCKDEGRLRIYRTVESVDGFFNPYTDGRYLAKYSFKERNRSFADVLAITPDTIKGIQPLLKLGQEVAQLLSGRETLAAYCNSLPPMK